MNKWVKSGKTQRLILGDWLASLYKSRGIYWCDAFQYLPDEENPVVKKINFKFTFPPCRTITELKGIVESNIHFIELPKKPINNTDKVVVIEKIKPDNNKRYASRDYFSKKGIDPSEQWWND